MSGRVRFAAVVTSVLAALLLGFVWGSRSRPRPERALPDTVDHRELDAERIFRARGGWWTQRRAADPAADASQVERLRGLSYVTGSHPAGAATGVVRHLPEQAQPGLNLYSSGHAPEALLIDMGGRVLHRWSIDRDLVWPELAGESNEVPARYFRRVRYLEDGGLLAIYEYTGLVRLDRSSNLLWASRLDNHHDLDVDRQGRIWVLGQKIVSRPRFKTTLFRDELIAVLDPQGEVVDSFSLHDCIASSRYAPLLDFAARVPGDPPADVFHANTLEVLDEDHPALGPAFVEGNLLVSLRNVNTIGVIDPRERKMVWSMTGPWRLQHQPVLLPTDRILLFDNLGGLTFSRVLEIDPLRQVVEWEYRGSEEEPFFSSLMGSNQRLANGNTLITESDYGRAFEVTPDGRIVWEFKSPHTTGERDELVAILPEMIRLAPDLPGIAADRPEPPPD